MQFEVLGIDYDRRIECFMVNARADYDWYLEKTQGSETNLEIQRDVIKGTKQYRTLRADLKLGCVLPTIVLAVRNVDFTSLDKYNKSEGFLIGQIEDLKALEAELNKATPADVDIVDGLQRTNALRQTLAEIEGEARAEFLSRSLRLEIWVGIPFYSLAYRMLLLNAGQKPMSMKHQIDILSRGLADDLKDLPGIEIITIKDHKRRVRPGQFHLSTLSQAFQAWLQRNPNVDVKNLVVETLMVDEALDTLGIDLGGEGAEHRDSFRNFIKWMINLDYILGDQNNRFLGNDTVFLGFAAAFGFCYKNDQLRDRVEPAIDSLLAEARSTQENPIGVKEFDTLRRSIDTKRSNVGEATRDFVFRSVREYIMQNGTSTMVECWTQSASMI
jgi:hypothetical protein